ncbi:MAG: carboxypeptidase regulatory-like domain-containing protein [Bryobacterales bacterium]|nr:carboxypeptidase regulatory-like domain-containing protein [Bryobacterales bacterium]
MGLLFAFLFGAGLYAQSITGALTGTVTDPTGAAVPSVAVKLTSAATGVSRSSSTNEAGRFYFGSLQPGAYTLTVEAQGFRGLEQSNINVSAAETVTLPAIGLQVGQLTDSIQVHAEAAMVQTQTAERSGVLTTSQLQSLAIRGRNVTSLISLLPGVVDLDDPENLSNGWNFYVQGSRQNTNNVTIDGATTNAIGNMYNSVVNVSMDAVAEVKVLTSNFQAEYGRMSGGNIQVVTKSGTKEFHGLASYFKRNEWLNANDFFNNRLGRPRPLYRFDTWNYQIGGPVYIPGKFNRNRDKLFFFWSQEFWPLTTPVPLAQRTTPTELERRGDFSRSIDVNNALIVVRDPYNGNSPFPGNIIPANRVDPNGQALLKFLPLPNFLDRNISRGNYNYVFQTSLNQPKRTETLKIDYNINQGNILTFSYTGRIDDATGPSGTPAGAGNYDVVSQKVLNHGKLLGARYQKIFSPTLISETNASYSTRPWYARIAPDALKTVQRGTIGFTAGQLYPDINPLGIIPNMSFGGVTNPIAVSFDGRTIFNSTHEIFTFSHNVTKTFTAHTLKVGFYYDRIRAENQAIVAAFNGSFNFGRNVNNPLDTGYAFSNAALGVFSQYDEPTGRPFPVMYSSNIEWFAQDTWKVTRRFSLDYGMRFSYLPQSWIDGDALSGFRQTAYDPAQAVQLIQPALQGNTRVGRNPNTGEILPATTIGAIASGRGNPYNGMVSPLTSPGVPRSLMAKPGILLGPRFGFAWDVMGNGRTSVRGGVGVVYNRMAHGSVMQNFTVQPPIVARPTIYYSTISDLNASPGFMFPSSVLGLDPEPHIPRVTNFSLTVQRDVGFETLVDAAYVGSLGRHLLWSRNLNAIPFGTNFLASSKDTTNNSVLPPNFLRPQPGWGDISMIEPASSSNYHSLQVSVNRRYTSRLQYNLSYTWSKSLDYNSGDGDSVSTLVPVRVWNYGLSSFDRRHVLKVNWQYDLPGIASAPALVKAATSGWAVSGIYTAVSGAPLGVGFGTVNSVDITGSPTNGSRIDVTGNPVLPRGERSFYRWFDTSVFARPAIGTFGNSARTVVTGPGTNNFDLSAFKNFRVKERFEAQFRAEFYNAFNHTQFSAVDTTARFDAQLRQVNTQFAQVTATRPGRRIQLALRLSF